MGESYKHSTSPKTTGYKHCVLYDTIFINFKHSQNEKVLGTHSGWGKGPPEIQGGVTPAGVPRGGADTGRPDSPETAASATRRAEPWEPRGISALSARNEKLTSGFLAGHVHCAGGTAGVHVLQGHSSVRDHSGRMASKGRLRTPIPRCLARWGTPSCRCEPGLTMGRQVTLDSLASGTCRAG